MNTDKIKLKKRKIVQVGNSHGFTIPKTFFKSEFISKDKKYDIEIKEADSDTQND